MKRLIAVGLAIAVLLSLNTGALAQQDAQAKQAGAHPNPNGNANQVIDPYATAFPAGQNVYSWVNPQYQVSGLPGQTNFNLTFTGDLGWFRTSDQTVGIGLTPADDALRTHLSIPKNQGLVVTSLEANAPAAQAGIQQNDVLLKIGDTPLAKTDDLVENLKTMGDKAASLTLLRAGKGVVIQVQPQVRVTLGPVQAKPPAFWIGVSVSPLEPALRSQLKLAPNKGLLAIDVVKESPAAKADVKVHDILLSLDGKALESQEKLIDAVQSSGQKSVQLELVREGKTQTIVLTPARRQPEQEPQANQNGKTGFYYYTPTGPGIVSADANGGWVTTFPNWAYPSVDYTSSPAGPKAVIDYTASSKRLEDLDGELKQLRKAIEELNKILKDKK
jgi:membrane-associated protease RseP (regulator of RpoE activity)